MMAQNLKLLFDQSDPKRFTVFDSGATIRSGSILEWDGKEHRSSLAWPKHNYLRLIWVYCQTIEAKIMHVLNRTEEPFKFYLFELIPGWQNNARAALTGKGPKITDILSCPLQLPVHVLCPLKFYFFYAEEYCWI